MVIYVVDGESVTAVTSITSGSSEDQILIHSVEELEASNVPTARMVKIWNALPGTAQVAKFRDRKTAARRLWDAFQELPIEAGLVHVASGPRAGSKQAAVIDLLKRPEGVTVSEVMQTTGWQPHTVRGMFSGALRKKQGLTVVSSKEERGRVYRIGASPA